MFRTTNIIFRKKGEYPLSHNLEVWAYRWGLVNANVLGIGGALVLVIYGTDSHQVAVFCFFIYVVLMVLIFIVRNICYIESKRHRLTIEVFRDDYILHDRAYLLIPFLLCIIKGDSLKNVPFKDYAPQTDKRVITEIIPYPVTTQISWFRKGLTLDSNGYQLIQKTETRSSTNYKILGIVSLDIWDGTPERVGIRDDIRDIVNQARHYIVI